MGNTARVIADFGADYLIDDGTSTRRAMARRSDPAVGDWVVVEGDLIVEVMPRRTAFSRRAAGVENRQQILAANVDVAFVVAAATDVNERRIERYLTIAWQSGAVPLVVITKADLVPSFHPPPLPAPVIVTSSLTGEGLGEVAAQLVPDRTGVLLGPSGAGKSSLINGLTGTQLMRTREVHRTGEGRHMTSHRQLIRIPGGGAIIDTPGLREAQLWEGEDALSGVFEDVEDLALRCRFSDCVHDTEPGCAVKAAISTGVLDAGRLQSYRKLQRELRAIAAKSDARIRIEDRKKWKHITMSARSKIRP
ncbi:MAG TPA: ribosome small subunit-dependent GTPase A [Candidatus Dormibacteraeota bacterium]|nr:ribosome small subunit-dependent GTPase A [Candidatus Dormibacteraeota bacterium]